MILLYVPPLASLWSTIRIHQAKLAIFNLFTR